MWRAFLLALRFASALGRGRLRGIRGLLGRGALLAGLGDLRPAVELQLHFTRRGRRDLLVLTVRAAVPGIGGRGGRHRLLLRVCWRAWGRGGRGPPAQPAAATISWRARRSPSWRAWPPSLGR